MHGGSADAAEGSEDEDGPAGLDFDGAFDELRAGEQDERERGGLLKAELVRDGSEHVGLCGGELGVGAIGHRHDPHAFGEADDAVAGADDFACEVAAEDGAATRRPCALRRSRWYGF